jgi:putative membrane protein insertion efficiency factor
MVRVYQIFLSPFLGGACKFYPSCSHYAVEAIQRHGARRGFVLAMKRLGRCRPFTKGGYDPVPDKETMNANLRAEEPVN